MSFDGDLPKGFKQTEIGLIPEDWEVVMLGELGSHNKPALKAGPFGSALTESSYAQSGYKIYGQEQVISGNAYFGNYYIDRAKYSSLVSCAVKPGDILISLVGTTGKVLLVPEDAEPGIINPRLVRFSPDPRRVSSLFAKWVIESDDFQLRLERISQGGTMEVLSLASFAPTFISLPPLPEQQAIAEALSDVDGLIAELEALLAKKRDLKQATAQTLLTGQTRLQGFDGAWREVTISEAAECLDHLRVPLNSSEREQMRGDIP